MAQCAFICTNTTTGAYTTHRTHAPDTAQIPSELGVDACFISHPHLNILSLTTPSRAQLNMFLRLPVAVATCMIYQ
eukprot:m.84510 g.84510  ORF g.84510 m.84510 type:complete len:76 (+) comp12749_c0_seq4:68-295(+)